MERYGKRKDINPTCRLFIWTVSPFTQAFRSQLGIVKKNYAKNKRKNSVQLIARWRLMTNGAAVVVYIDCEQNGDMSKHWVSGGLVSRPTCHSDDNHWSDIYEEEIVQLY